MLKFKENYLLIKYLMKFAQVITSFVIAMALAWGVTHIEPVQAAISSSDFSAALIDPGDRPQDAMNSSFKQAVVGIINYALGFLGLIAVAFIVYAGILMVMDGGAGKSVETAKKI
ncbi:MAG TPA: hypothetical protein PLQ36_00975, partial [Candidatus Gracilibacteria bacterium]|nr:hypothetical protein [Candidatus Gracilibacteria bacterium]